MKYSQVSLRFYIRGEYADERAGNLKALAPKYFPTPDGKGNFSELVNMMFNKYYGLDPKTGKQLKHSRKAR